MTAQGIGQSVRRVEDERLITGQGLYVGDVRLPQMAHAVVLFSMHAHAQIVSINTQAAAEAEGVLLVLTGKDIVAEGLGGLPPLFMPEDMGGPKGFRTSQPLLALDRVRHVGDRVAFVVAETQELARQAAELIEVEYTPLPAVEDPLQARQPEAPKLWDGCADNVCFTVELGDAQSTERIFATAPHVVAIDVRSPRLTACPIEPRGAVGHHRAGDETFTLWTGSQNPHGARTTLAERVFGLPAARIRVISPDVGGGFGMKADIYPEDALVLCASRRIGRPVRWIPTRGESLVSDNCGRGQVIRGEGAFDEKGKLLAIRSDSSHAVGAYVMSAAAATILFGARFIPNVYDVQNVHLVGRAVFTNTAPLGPYRGAGRPEAIFLIERLLDKAAQFMAISADEIRRRNLIKAAAMPYRTSTGFDYDSGEFEVVLDRCLRLSDWAGFEERRAGARTRGRLRGIGIACFIELAGVFNDRMEVRFDPSGSVTIVAGTHSHGQGHATTYAQLVNEWLAVPLERIAFIQGDTDKVPFGRGTYAARSSMIGGAALKMACDRIIGKATRMAAFLLQADHTAVAYGKGRFSARGTDKSLPLEEVAKAFFRMGAIPAELGSGLSAVGYYSADPANFPNGCHICEVEIDPQTGAVSVERYSAVDDCGRVVNPMICKGQLHGGIAQGLGQALLENLRYDKDTAQCMTGSFMDYALPRAPDVPNIQSEFHEVPCKTNPLGIKGIAEAGAIAAPSAIINAIVNALSAHGIEHIDMPATPASIWQSIADAKTATRDQHSR